MFYFESIFWLLNIEILFNLLMSYIVFSFLVTGLLVITTESAIHAILFLMFLFAYMMELCLILKMEFLGLIFIIIYIGAVCVLMLFHIKLIRTFVHKFDDFYNDQIFLPSFFLIFLIPLMQLFSLAYFNFDFLSLGELDLGSTKSIFTEYQEYNRDLAFSKNDFNIFYVNWLDYLSGTNNLSVLGVLLYNVYFMYMVYGSFILLIAMVGSILITSHVKKLNHFQKIKDQLYIDLVRVKSFDEKKSKPNYL